MANPTMTLIASNTVGSGGVSSVTFSSIPATYTDLVIKCSMRLSDTSPNWFDCYLSFNSSSTANQTQRVLYGSGASANSISESVINFRVNNSGGTSNTFGNAEIYIPNYTSSNYKSVSIDAVTEQNATNAYAGLQAGLWSSTAAITSIVIAPPSSNIVQYSTFYLYGIASS